MHIAQRVTTVCGADHYLTSVILLYEILYWSTCTCNETYIYTLYIAEQRAKKKIVYLNAFYCHFHFVETKRDRNDAAIIIHTRRLYTYIRIQYFYPLVKISRTTREIVMERRMPPTHTHTHTVRGSPYIYKCIQDISIIYNIIDIPMPGYARV